MLISIIKQSIALKTHQRLVENHPHWCKKSKNRFIFQESHEKNILNLATSAAPGPRGAFFFYNSWFLTLSKYNALLLIFDF